MLELDEIKRLHETGYTYNTTTRERAANDSTFHWVSMWDENTLNDSQLQFRGEFNILRKASRQITQDLRSNEIQIDFQPTEDQDDDGADLIDGMYRTDDRKNTSLEAYDNASSEAIVCGIGGWELRTEYVTNRAGNRNQGITRYPIPEFNNNCFCDPNAKLLDKSDSNFWSILVPYSKDGLTELINELTGEPMDDINLTNFATPEISYTFPWINGQSDLYYIARFYHRAKVKDIVYTFTDPFGEEILLRKSDITDIEDELLDSGYTITGEKSIKRWKITLYYVTGERIIKTYDIPGDNLPVVPTYGERAFVEGEEYYEGVTRLAKDPSRLRNFYGSYLADIVSRSPRNKPIFNPEQIQGFEHMYSENGADNNYPYLLQNSKDAGGNPLPPGPVGELPEQRMPQALLAAMDFTRQAVEDVANPGLPQDIADPDLSGKAILALQNRLDQQSAVYQQNLKHAKRRDAEIYAGMASVIYDAPRSVRMTLPDGSVKMTTVMETIQDRETGEMKVINDLTNSEFDVYADIGPSYSNRREQTIEQIDSTIQLTADPNLQQALILKKLALMEGQNFDDIRDYANNQLVLRGFKEPETDEQREMLAQSQENQEPDAAMVLAQAEMLKGQAQMAREQREGAKNQADIQNDKAGTVIDMFEAQTARAKVQVDAQKAGAEIQYKHAQTMNQQVQTAQAYRARVNGG